MSTTLDIVISCSTNEVITDDMLVVFLKLQLRDYKSVGCTITCLSKQLTTKLLHDVTMLRAEQSMKLTSVSGQCLTSPAYQHPPRQLLASAV